MVKSAELFDPQGRKIRKLRVSLLDACNFRCTYCMPENPQFMSRKQWLKPEEIETICRILSELGLEQIRITGGEPTLRKEFPKIMSLISKLPIKKLGLTTNGYLLEQHLPFLLDTACRSINISIDSLNEERFNAVTRSRGFKHVISATLKAKQMGFQVKINTVLMRGVNDQEITDFVAFSAKHNIEVRFLELMRIGQACTNQSPLFISAGEVIEQLKKDDTLTKTVTEFDATSFNFKTNSGAHIGFIASESVPFCGSCSRLRLSADGFLRACLMSEKGLSLKGLEPRDCENILHQVMRMKPSHRIPEIHQDMHQIGG